MNYQTRVQKAQSDYIKFLEKYPKKDCISLGDIFAVYDVAKSKHPYELIGDALEIGYMYGYRRGIKDGKKAAKGEKA